MNTTSTSSGWNRSTSTPKPAPKKPSAMRGVVAGLVVVALASICAVMFMGKGEKPVEKVEKKPVKIKEVAPKLPPKSAAQLEKEAHPGQVKVRGKWYPEFDEKGGRIWVRSKDVTYHTPVVVTNRVSSYRRTKESLIFDHRSDADIAVLLNGENTLFLGPYPYGERFVKDFLESLKTPIIVSHDDDEETKMLKRAVNETRIELKARYDAGEDIAKIMEDTRKDLQELGMYREQMRQEIKKIAAEQNLKGKDCQDLVDAANKMLAERGVKPLSAPGMFRRRMALEVEKETNQGNNK